jgi:hypothetical protein
MMMRARAPCAHHHVHLLLRLGQREPGLDARQRRAGLTLVAGRAFGMDDALARGHQIDRAGLDPLARAERIAMVDRAVEQIGDCREVDVRMRTHVDAVADFEMRRPHLVEEQERADHRPLLVGQRAVDLEAAEVVGDRGDGLKDEVIEHGQAPFR